MSRPNPDPDPGMHYELRLMLQLLYDALSFLKLPVSSREGMGRQAIHAKMKNTHLWDEREAALTHKTPTLTLALESPSRTLTPAPALRPLP